LRSLVVVSVREGRRAVTTTPVIQSGRFIIINKTNVFAFKIGEAQWGYSLLDPNPTVPSNAHISTPFFQKTVFFSKIFFGKPP